MTVVPINESNSSSLLQLWNRSTPYDQLGEKVFFEKIWGDSDYREELGLVMQEGDKPVAMAFGVVRQMVSERRGHVKLLAVAPEFRRRGIARKLVQELHSRLCRLEVSAIRVGESAPNYLFPGLDVRYTEAAKLAESLEYKEVGEARNLLAELDGRDFSDQTTKGELAAKGVEIKRAQHEDASAIDVLIAKYWPAWRAEIATTLQNEPISLHLAIKEEQVVGFSAYDSNNLGTGWFGPMGTAPEVRALGIGKVLMLRCLQDIQAQGHSRAIIAWVSPTGLYAMHANAKPDRTFRRYEKRFFQADDKRELSGK